MNKGLACVVAAVVATMALPATVAGADDAHRRPALIGRAVLPALTVADGPPSGAAVADANGINFPIDGHRLRGGSAPRVLTANASRRCRSARSEGTFVPPNLAQRPLPRRLPERSIQVGLDSGRGPS
jgi:hypothetical protein